MKTKTIALVSLLLMLLGCQSDPDKEQHISVLDPISGKVMFTYNATANTIVSEKNSFMFKKGEHQAGGIAGPGFPILVSDKPLTGPLRHTNTSHESPELQFVIMINREGQVVWSAGARIDSKGHGVEPFGDAGCMKFTTSQGNTRQIACPGNSTTIFINEHFPENLQMLTPESPTAPVSAERDVFKK